MGNILSFRSARETCLDMKAIDTITKTIRDPRSSSANLYS